ncbi:MAG: cysteine hydrolase [Hydrogenophaga sp.]|uniref:cysteine hydrolase n=1 Tax=Hydrogenophaga sp. TaxID=1904254 RepID=UPI0025BEBD93|nr:cysteine hydrolase [Hydrogenophaga sp.]MBU7573332.1 cysteine hydrolase [Hydrogenophaga sp.]
MRTKLLIIDPQNDFCDIEGAALPVTGARDDLRRLARFIDAQAARLSDITVTLDSHASVAVERTSFWLTREGEAVAPFTFITAASVAAGEHRPRDARLTGQVMAMLDQLATAGKQGMVVWPVHCVTATWGHNIQSDLANSLAAWEMAHQRAVTKVLKGEYPLTEHFGVFEADAPVASVPGTQFNRALAASVASGADFVAFAGQASSHCVAASYDQFMRFLASAPAFAPRVVLLRDCMSPVPGFETLADGLFERARAAGSLVLGVDEFAARIR